MEDLFSSQNQKQSTLPDDCLQASRQRRSGKNGSGRMRPERAPSVARSEQTELFETLPKKATPHTLEQVLKQTTFADFWDYQTLLTQSRDIQGRPFVLEVQSNHCLDNPHESNLHKTGRP